MLLEEVAGNDRLRAMFPQTWVKIKGARDRVEAVVQAGARPDPTVKKKGKVGRDHPETAKKAAFRATPNSGTQRERVLTMLKKAWPGGYTDQEMETALRMYHSSLTARRLELREMGWIKDSGKTRETEAGLDAIVWVFIPEHEVSEEMLF